MSPSSLAAFLIIAVLGALIGGAPAANSNAHIGSNSVASLDKNDYRTWVIKSVCANPADDIPLLWDPYYPCPSPSVLRNLKVGEAFPYNNYEQTGGQISDSFALLDANGGPLYIHTFDYYPFNQFNQHSGSDGYDVYHVSDKTVSYSNTKDGGGYGSTFYGKNCNFGDGWVLFPTSNFLTSSGEGGEGYWPISGVYWEQKGQPFPGSCPNGYSTNTNTLWELLPSFEFSGINSNPSKFMDTIVSYHGYETDDGVNPTSNFMQQGHLEVFYFTKEYGITRWEVWAPIVDSISRSASGWTECSGSQYGTFKKVNFTKINCHDWSNVKVLGQSVLPAWPLVNANLLQHFHFESSKYLVDSNSLVGLWHRFGGIDWGIGLSSGGSDNNNGVGVSYLSVSCGASSCGQAGSQAVYQDVPFVFSNNSNISSYRFLYGVNAKTVSGTGSLQIALQALDSGNKVKWQNVVTCEDLRDDNGDGRAGEAESVYLSSRFISSTVTIPNDASTVGVNLLRFLIIPNTPKTFQIVDSFLNPFP
jgi:hypothetical protein